MLTDITHYEILRKSELSYYGMVSGFAARNVARMEQNGLKAARKRIGLGQAEIAERLGVSVPQVSRWENGRTITRTAQPRHSWRPLKGPSEFRGTLSCSRL